MPLGLRFVFFRHGNDVQRDFVKVGPALGIWMIADDKGDFAGELACVLAVEQVGKAVVVARNEDRDFRAIAGRRYTPLHFEVLGDRLEMHRELRNGYGKAGELPFNSDEEEIQVCVEMFVPIDDVAVAVGDEIGDRSRDALAVGAADKQSGGFLHGCELMGENSREKANTADAELECTG